MHAGEENDSGAKNEAQPSLCMLVIERVPVPQTPPVPLKPQQVMQVPLVPGGAPITFGRGRDCSVRTDGPGVQAELALDAKGEHMTLTFCGVMPAPEARTTKDAPHGLRVVTRLPDEFFEDGRLKNRTSRMTQVTGSYPLTVGETIVFTLHAAPRTCFTVREVGPSLPVDQSTEPGASRKCVAAAEGCDRASKRQRLQPAEDSEQRSC